MKEQLLAAAGVTGSLTASQQALAGRLAALQLAVKQQRLQQQQQGGSGDAADALLGSGAAVGDCGGGGGGGGGPEDGPEMFWPTCYSDVCMLGDVAASNND
jgi:hypothetical protein